MAIFGKRSERELETLEAPLQTLLEMAIQIVDFVVLEGHRSQYAQDAAFDKGFSKVQWPNSAHNSQPSRAVDIAPYPVDWNDTKRFYYLAGVVQACAVALDMDRRLTWGGDWDSDQDFSDQTFMDLVHYELEPAAQVREA